MANKKKRKPNAPRPAAASGAPRQTKSTGAPRQANSTGPSQREKQLAAQRMAQRQATLRRAGVTGAVALVGIAVVGGVVALDRRGDAQLRADLTAGTCEVDTRTDRTGPAGQNHVPSPSYRVNPPAGGDHLASAARAGTYSVGSVPDDGLLVHSLEHGYVIAWHQPDLPADQLAQLEAFQQQHDDDVLVVERSDLPVPVAATAWGQRLLCQQVETGPLERFVDEHVGNGPEDVPRG